VIATGSPALAQYAPGSIGNGGRMPETMSPGALPPPQRSRLRARCAFGLLRQSLPNTESYSRDRIESQGYKVERITPQNNGSWKAETSRDAVRRGRRACRARSRSSPMDESSRNASP
jgi:hypothetical protein